MPSLRHCRLPLGAGVLLLFSLSACAEQSAASQEHAIAYQSGPLPAYVGKLLGAWDLWQDGEGGPSCAVQLTDQAILGGFAIEAEADCASKLDLAEEPYAWFLNDHGQLIIVDGARQALLRLNDEHDGSFKDRRAGDYSNAVLLTRP
jgi:hypothetical protein